MTFTARQVLTAAQLNDLSIDTLTTSGTVTIGGFSLPAVDGTADQVLVTNGSGTVTWQDPSGGGTPGGSDGQVQYNNGGSFGGASALYYDDVNSRVGIGTTSPVMPIDFNAPGSDGARMRFEDGTSGTSGIQFTANGSAVDYSTQPFFGKEGVNDSDPLGIWHSGSWRLVVNSSGNVGIGTTSPSVTLDVAGEIGVNGLTLSNVVSSGSMRVQGTDGYIDIGPKNTGYAHIYTDRPGFYMDKWLNMAGGTTVRGDFDADGDINFKNNALVAAYVDSGNIDHIWHDDGSNTWNFCSDTTYKNTGNSSLRSGSLTTGTISSGAITASGEIRANSNISLRSGNSVHDSIYRVGGVFFTWDSDSYGTNDFHSIRSTNGDTWTDAITINSYGNIRMNIDSNGNGTNTFTVGRHTTGTANTLLTLDESGNLTVTGDLFATDLDVSGVARANEFRADDYGPANDASFTFAGDEDMGMYRNEANSIGFSTGGVRRTLIHSDGHIYQYYQLLVPNMDPTGSYNTIRWNSSNGHIMRYSSTIEIKQDIVSIVPVMEYLNERSLIHDLRPVLFHERDRPDGTNNTRGEYLSGMIAEEVLEVAPELCYYDQNGELVSYGLEALIPHLIAEIQRLTPLVEEMYGTAHPDWVAPTPRPPERSADERQRYDEAATAQALVGQVDLRQ